MNNDISPTSTLPRRRISRTGLLLLLIAGFIVLIVGFSIALTASARAYLRSDAFRLMVSREVSRELQVEGEFQPLQWTGSSAYSAGFHGRGLPGSAYAEVHAEQIRAQFNLGGIWRRAWQIDRLDVGRLQVKLGGVQPATPLETAFPSRPAPPAAAAEPGFDHHQQHTSRPAGGGWFTGLLPREVDLKEAVVEQVNLEWPGQEEQPGRLTGVQLNARPDGRAWLLHGTGGRFAHPGVPEFHVDEVRLRYHDDRIYVTQGLLRHVEQGTVGVNGDVNLRGEEPELNLQFTLHNFAIAPFLPEDWRVKLQGSVKGDVRVSGPATDLDRLQASGELQLISGSLEALPVLNQLALFTRTERYRQLTLQRGSVKFSYLQNRLSARDLMIESETLLRLEGNVDVDLQSEALDGLFQVGLAPGTLRWIPGAEKRVFSTQREGYIWAPMKLTGSVDRPREDLTPRLVSAARDSIVDDAGEVIRRGAKDIRDILGPLFQ